MRSWILVALVGSCGSLATAGQFVPVSQTRTVETSVRAFNNGAFIDDTDSDQDAASNFDDFHANITSKATAAQMHITSTSKQDSVFSPYEISGGASLHGTYTAVPGGLCFYDFEGEAACTFVFDLTEAMQVDFTAALQNAPLTDSIYVFFRGPSGFIASAMPFPVGNPNAEFHGVLPAGRYRIEALYSYGASGIAPTQPSAGTPQGWSFSLTTPPPPVCDGDTNGDNVVNGADLSVLLANFGSGAAGPGQGDFNGDSVCNGADLSVLLANFGESC